ncbi:hypothetical protein GGR56DRAFT_663474 [Xylariaceae sp. FL0804]|nr:hypothetical protein GGR56DRAFT_663474 [Xylariaceae sp. FL0804]
MDPASLDPRLRDAAGEDSITVHDSSQPPPQQQPPPPPIAVAAASATPSDASDDSSPSHPQQSPADDVSPTYIPHTPLAANPLAAGAAAPGSSDTPPGGAGPYDPNDPKRPRACEACRGLKVKCEPDPANPDGPCKRCAKAGRACVVTQPTRKRQKKTDSRVAELEKKIDALTASLQATRGGGGGGVAGPANPDDPNGYGAAAYAAVAPRDWGVPPPPRDPPPPQSGDDGASSSLRPPSAPLAMAGQKRKFSPIRESSADTKEPSVPPPAPPGRQHADMIDRGIITTDDADILFKRYTDRMAIHLPAVVFPRGTTFSDVRKSKPILFLAVMAVASSEQPNIQRQLTKELTQIFAESIIITGIKTLEMIQAILVSVIWYHPPEHFEELQFYQYIHLAAVMAVDIGLGRKKNNPKSRLIPYTWRDHPFRKSPLPDPTTIEARRTWLAAYFLASNVAMALHRQNLVRWQAFMAESLEVLENSPEAAPTDRYLCHLVWTQNLAEEVGIQFSMDDPNVFPNISEAKIQYALRGFERDLAKYSDGIPKEDKQPALLLSFHVLSLYMHEISLYVDKNSDEYRAPINAEALRDPIPGLGNNLTAAHIGALSACLTAIDGIFESFLCMDVEVIRCLPIFNFVRVAYAVVVLIKMYFSASSPNSDLGKVINKDNMKVAEYLDRLLDKFRNTAASDKSRPAGKFLVVLVMLRGWFFKQGQSRIQADEQIDPSLRAPQANGGAKKPQNVANPSRRDGPQRHQQEPRHQPPPPPQQQQQVPRQQQHQQHQQQPSEYNAANTPLQLLSEIATGNGVPRSGQNGAAPSDTSANNPASYQSWMQAGADQFMYGGGGGPNNAAASSAAMGPDTMPWGVDFLGADMDYSSMGDGFEQAMGLTLTGFGGGSPGDPASYEQSMRMMMQNNAMLDGMFDNLPPGGGPFNFGF